MNDENLPLHEILDRIIEDIQEIGNLYDQLVDDRLVENVVDHFLKLQETFSKVEHFLKGRIKSLKYNIGLINKKIKQKKPFTQQELSLSNERLVNLAHEIEFTNNLFHQTYTEKTENIIELHNIMLNLIVDIKHYTLWYNNTFESKLYQLNDALKIYHTRYDKTIQEANQQSQEELTSIFNKC
jgi:hypothetical protein